MTKEKIFDYLKHTPYNTNFNILDSMLDELIKGGSSMIVHFTGEATFNQETGEFNSQNLKADKTLEEVYSAYEAGTPVFGEYTLIRSNTKGGVENKINYFLPLSIITKSYDGQILSFFGNVMPASGSAKMTLNGILWLGPGENSRISGTFTLPPI